MPDAPSCQAVNPLNLHNHNDLELVGNGQQTMKEPLILKPALESTLRAHALLCLGLADLKALRLSCRSVQADTFPGRALAFKFTLVHKSWISFCAWQTCGMCIL